jgi:hypothetical protein
MTGRGAGFCRGNASAGFTGSNWGRGAWGRGGGRGWRNCFWATGQTGWQRLWSGFGRFAAGSAGQSAAPPENELQHLKEQAGYLEDSLKEVHGRISELEAPPKKK